MIREAFRVRVESHIEEAVGQGARQLTGGRRPADGRGYFYPPTVLAEVDHGMRVMRDETFGPVIPLMAFDDFDEAIRLANEAAKNLPRVGSAGHGACRGPSGEWWRQPMPLAGPLSSRQGQRAQVHTAEGKVRIAREALRRIDSRNQLGFPHSPGWRGTCLR